MKKTNFLRFFCALLGIITLLSSIPVFAEDSTSTETTVTPFDVTFDFEYGKEITDANGTLKDETQANGLHTGNISPYINNSDIAVSTPYDIVQATTNRCFIMKNPTVDNNYALKVADASSYFAVEDVNKKLPDGDFTVSVDVYLNLASISNTQSLIQWIRDESLPTTGNDGNAKYKNHIVRTNNQGQITFCNTVLNTYLEDATWQNITVKARCVSNNTYEVSLFVDKNFVANKVYTVSVPTEGNIGSYIVFFSRNNSGAKNSYMDNIHIYDTYTPDMKAPLDVYMDFDYGKAITKHLNGSVTDTTQTNGLATGNLTPYLYNPDISVRTPYDYIIPDKNVRDTNGCFTRDDPGSDDSTDYALRIESANSYFAVKDIYNKLAGADFTVSADVYLDLTNLGANVPLIQYIRNAELVNTETNITNKYCFISANKDGQLVANSKALGVYLKDLTWHNITAKATRVSEDTYEISLYLDDTHIYTYFQDMSAPTDGTEGSYIVFLSRTANCRYSFVDNIHIYETPDDRLDDDILDVALDFNTLTTGKVVQGTDFDASWLNIGELLNTDKIVITFPMDNGGGNFAYQTVAANNGKNIVLQIVSASSYIAVEDLGSRLEKSDFIVSADMRLNFDLTKFTTGTLSLLQWSKGAKLGSTNYNLVSVDNHGQLFAGGNGLGVYVDLNDWFNIAARVDYLTDDSYEVAIYLDEKLIYVYNLEMPSGERSFIRFLGTGASGFKGSCIDNLRISKTQVYDAFFEKNVVWDVDFNGFENESVMNADNWSAASSIYPVVSVGGENKIENGRLKITSPSASTATELSIGGKGYYPVLKYGSAAISMKFELSALGATDVIHNLISWRRLKGEASILGFKNNSLVFCGITLSDKIEVGNEYDLKVVIDGYKMVAELYVGGVKKVTAPITDINAGISIFNKFSDIISMFASSANDASVAYYVDDLKVERVDNISDFDISFDFTGWSGYSSLPLSETTIGFQSGGSSVPTVEKTADGNEYLSINGNRRFYLNDVNGELLFKNTVLEFDLYYTAGNGNNAVNEDGTINTANRKNIVDCNNVLNGNTGGGFLFADGVGHLIVGSTVIAENISGAWTPIKIEFIPDAANTGWTTLKVYVDGTEKYSGSFSKAFVKEWCFRFMAQSVATFGFDNVRLYTVEAETTEFTLDFNGDYTSALEQMGQSYFYPEIDSTREGSNKVTITSAQVLTEQITVDEKVENHNYLRIDRSYLKADQPGFFRVDKSKYTVGNEYIVEANFSLTSTAGFGITPVTIVSKNNEKQFAPVEVVGYYNTLKMSMRGVPYDLCDANGNLLKVKTTEDTGFTSLAILINENDSTYTVYVDQRLAYYFYDGEYLPAAGIPINYKETGMLVGVDTYLKIMETPSTKSNHSTIDIERVAVISATSGINTSFRAAQSNLDDLDGFAIRFIGGIDALYGNAVGFKVKTTYTKDNAPVTTETTMTTPTVYSSILEVGNTVTAKELGSNYLFLMSVNKLPYTVGTVNFEIVPFVEHGGKTFKGQKTVVTAQYANNKVTFIIK